MDTQSSHPNAYRAGHSRDVRFARRSALDELTNREASSPEACPVVCERIWRVVGEIRLALTSSETLPYQRDGLSHALVRKCRLSASIDLAEVW